MPVRQIILMSVFWVLSEVTGYSLTLVEPIRIVPTGPLVASVGDTVLWEFKAMRGSRELTIIASSANGLPFGVVPKNEAGQAIYSGKVLGRQFRSGFISVSAFDKVGCEKEYSNTKMIIVKNAILNGDLKNASVPLDPCLPENIHQGLSTSTTVTALFQWHMIDGPDAISGDSNKNFIQNLAKVALATSSAKLGKKQMAPKPRSMASVIIPVNQSPHTFFATLGTCSILPRTRCGDRPKDCLWILNTCVTKDIAGLKANEGAAK